MSVTHWEPVIGLEIHAQLATRSKLFSSAATEYGAEPNTQTSELDIALPGTLPVLNGAVVDMAIRFGIAVDATIARECVFARKNYFYPDLPKGYQISQYELPIVSAGRLTVELADGETKTIGITRAHLEEDAGKSVHDAVAGSTAIDLNRAGTPLLEIVSEPDIRSSAEAGAYMRKMHTLVRYLDICDGNLQEGSFRCDANVSVRPVGQSEFGTRTEIKNINSFRFIERAIDYEIHRQIHLIESGGEVVQETRLYDSDRNETRSMRTKEDADDYRYFPDPDLLPVLIDEAAVEAVRAVLPELPDQRLDRYLSEPKVTVADAAQLVGDRDVADYFEAAWQASGGPAKPAANWVLGELTAALRQAELDILSSRVSAVELGGLLKRIADGTISGKIAKQVFDAMWDGQGSADEIIEAQGLKQISDSGELEALVAKLLDQFPDQIAQYRSGDAKVLNFFVGQVMKATRGRANPAEVQKHLRAALDG